MLSTNEPSPQPQPISEQSISGCCRQFLFPKKGSHSLAQAGLESKFVPSTNIRWLITTCNSNSKESDSTSLYRHLHSCANMHTQEYECTCSRTCAYTRACARTHKHTTHAHTIKNKNKILTKQTSRFKLQSEHRK